MRQLYARCLVFQRLAAAMTRDRTSGHLAGLGRGRSLILSCHISPYAARGFFGHGIGCGYHEPPILNLSSDTPLQENMVLVVESILQVPGSRGAKIEDMFLVTAEGAERLSTLTLRPWREPRSWAMYRREVVQ